jgi:hypothetical protein
MYDAEHVAWAAKLLADIIIVSRARSGESVDLARLSKTITAAMVAAGYPYSRQWRDLYVTVATLLAKAPSLDESAQCTSLRRLSQFLNENADLECDAPL